MPKENSTLEVPGIPEVQPTPVSLRQSHRLWKLYYKRGGNPKCELIFEFNGEIQRVIQRARAYCNHMNVIFIHVDEFLHDLDEDEKAHMNS